MIIKKLNLATYSNLLIKKLEKINVSELTKELKFNNFDTNENEINKIIQQIIENEINYRI